MARLNPKETRFQRNLEAIFWFILRFIPLIVIMLTSYYSVAQGVDYNLLDLVRDSFCVSEESIVFTTLTAVVGPNGVLPMLTEETQVILLYLGYLVLLEIARLFVSLFLFIIRYCIKMVEKFM